MSKETKSSGFKKDLEYDYNKYINKFGELEGEVNRLLISSATATSPIVVSSVTWRNEHNQESYEETQQRLELEKLRRTEKTKSSHYQSWVDHGLFHRKLTFENGNNFYITTATVETDYDFGDGDFLISYWGTDARRVQSLMKFDIGDESPKNGELLIVGDFTPKKRDLINIRYKNKTGKQEYRSAKRAIENLEDEIPEIKPLIDTENFFRLKFSLAGMGDQSKALYDTNNAIIDGAAGTGKSTIALQKLKYLHETENISQKDMFVIVKNKEAISHFKTLLQDDELKLNDVEIQTVSSLFEILELDLNICKGDITQAIKSSKDLRNRILNDITNINRINLEKHFIHLFSKIGKQRFIDTLNTMLNEINSDKSKKEEVIQIDLDIGRINEDLISDDIEDEIKLELLDELKKLKNRRIQVTGENYKKALEIFETIPEKVSIAIYDEIVKYNYKAVDIEQVKTLSWIRKYINFYLEQERADKQLAETLEEIQLLRSLDEYNEELSGVQVELLRVMEELNFNSESDVLKKEFKTLKNKEKKIKSDIRKHTLLPAKQSRLENRLTKIFAVDQRDKRVYEKVLTAIYMTDQYITSVYLKEYSKAQSYLIRYYLLDMTKPFDTFIIDEAQDYSVVELELLRLQAKRVVLTGDILQNIQDNDLETWEDIINLDDVFGVENKAGDIDLNIFNLKHNFRQTYQLANASFNFRQLLLEGGIEDIEKEYYTSEKEFYGVPYSLPLLKYMPTDKKFKQYFDKKIQNIKNTYSSKIPIALIYKDTKEKEKYENILQHLRIGYDAKNLKNIDVILINILEAKGKEFPIVVCNIDEMKDKELYLIMTRAQFELDFITYNNDCSNQKIGQLVKHKWIKTDGIKGFSDFDVETEVAERKIDDLQSLWVGRNETFSKNIIDKLTTNDTKNVERLENQLDDIVVADEKVNDEKLSVDSDIKTTREKIGDHESDVIQTDDEIEIDVIFDEQKYKKSFVEQLLKQEIGANKKEIVFIRKEVDRDSTKIHNEIKSFLYKTYKGYCQSCGFTFRKTSDHQNSFEKFSWDDKRIVKINKNFISSAESLSLCRNCTANIKFGSFEPLFLKKILNIESFQIKSFDEIISILHNIIDVTPPEIFIDHTEFNDMFALEIKLNQKDRNIFFTKEHLIQFIIFLQLEKEI